MTAAEIFRSVRDYPDAISRAKKLCEIAGWSKHVEGNMMDAFKKRYQTYKIKKAVGK